MSERFKADLPSRDITPPEVFFNRRKFLSALAMGTLAAPRLLFGGGGQDEAAMLQPPINRPDVFPAKRNPDYTVPSAIEKKDLIAPEVGAGHNNFYELLANRGGPVWKYVEAFEVEPWKVEITGECEKPMTVDLDDLYKFDLEERVYHFRCVERWAMNIPWTGYPFRKLLEKVEPKATAKYVAFTTALRPEQM